MSGPAVNERVEYWSPFSGGPYDAVIRKVNEDGTVAIDVYLPGISVGRRNGADLGEPVVHLRSISYGVDGLARPLETR